MRLLASLLALALLVPAASADIQAPPGSDYGPTRKLGRGLSNFFLGVAEIPDTYARVNDFEGNSAAAGFGAVKGLGRALARIGVGAWEVLTFPFPTNKDSYRPHLRPKVPWIYSGYEEFPPELGWEDRYQYARVPAYP